MVRAAAKNHPSVAIVTSPRRYADVLAAVAAGGFTLAAAPAAGRRGVRAHRDLRRGRGVAGWAASLTDTSEGDRLPGLGRRRPGTRRRCCATARTRTSRPRSTATARRRPRRRPSSCTARRCPTTTTSTPTRPGGRRTTSTEPAVAIIKHANPCGIAVGADVAEAHRKAHECDPVSAFGGVIAVNRPVSVAMAEQVRRDLHRGDRRAGVRRRRGRGPRRARRTSGSWSCAPTSTRPRGSSSAPISGGVLMQQRRPRRRRRATTRRPGRSRPARPRSPRRAGRPGLRLAGLPRGEVQRDPARQGRRLGRHRHGPGQPGRLLPARGRAGRGPGRGLGRRVRRVLPVRGRPAGPHRRRRPRHRPARRVGARRADHRRRPRPPA